MPHLRGILICWWLRTLCWAFFLTICKRLRADCIAIFCDEDDPPLVDGLLPSAAAAADGIVLVLRAGIANDWCIAVEELGFTSLIDGLLKDVIGFGRLVEASGFELHDVVVSAGLVLGDVLLAISLILLTHWPQYQTCLGSFTSLSITRGSWHLWW